MPSVRSLVVILTVLFLVGHSAGQISFSPNWGTGKRSQPLGLDRDCWGRSDLRILFDVVKLIQKQADTLARCMSETENDDAMLKH